MYIVFCLKINICSINIKIPCHIEFNIHKVILCLTVQDVGKKANTVLVEHSKGGEEATSFGATETTG